MGELATFLDPRLPASFWDRCIPEPNSGCWLWLGTLDKDGYAMHYPRINGERVYGGYRVAYVVLIAPVSRELVLDHLCRTTCCVNPAHLEPVAQRTNVIRGTSPAAVNAHKETCSICGGELVSERPGDPNTWRRCMSCRHRTARALNARRAEQGLCRTNKMHGPATRGRRCDACAEEHRLREEARRTAKKEKHHGATS